MSIRISQTPAKGEDLVVDERSDTELLIASKGDPEVFTELYRRHAEDLLRYFARRTLDPETAAELMAETFADAFASRSRYTDLGVNGVAWLYGIARHQLGRFFRSGAVSAAARRRMGMPERELASGGLRTDRGPRGFPAGPRGHFQGHGNALTGSTRSDAAARDGRPGVRRGREQAAMHACERAAARQSRTEEARPGDARARSAPQHGGRSMKSDIAYLEIVEKDLAELAAKAKARAAEGSGRRSLSGRGRMPVAAAVVALLVAAGGIGFLAQGGRNNRARRAVEPPRAASPAARDASIRPGPSRTSVWSYHWVPKVRHIPAPEAREDRARSSPFRAAGRHIPSGVSGSATFPRSKGTDRSPFRSQTEPSTPRWPR